MKTAATAPANPSGPVPARRPGSIRRTSTISVHWPEEFGKPMEMHGHGRDLRSDDEVRGEVVAEDRVRILASPMREIMEIEAVPPRPELRKLIGTRAGGQSRAALADTLPEEKAAGTPLYLLIDDFAGASLVAGWAWSQWIDDWSVRNRRKDGKGADAKKWRMEGICTGFRPGSGALEEDGTVRHGIQSWAEVGPLVNSEDPDSWHAMPPQQGVGFRRSRWLDIWREDERVEVDLGFQDSSTMPDSEMRAGIHEYRARASVDPEAWTLEALDVEPRVLPFRECVSASIQAKAMIGTQVGEMREAVLNELHGIAGCTHLNDVLRSLAELPQLTKYLGK